jgi:hypothetical protein
MNARGKATAATPEVAPYIRERQWHPRQKINDLRTGGLILEFTTNHLNEVKDWVMSWGPGSTVLAPAALVEKVKEGLKEALANYCPTESPSNELQVGDKHRG